jgi:hypothetical protein
LDAIKLKIYDSMEKLNCGLGYLEMDGIKWEKYLQHFGEAKLFHNVRSWQGEARRE